MVIMLIPHPNTTVTWLRAVWMSPLFLLNTSMISIRYFFTLFLSVKEVYHLQKGLQNALKLIFLATLHLSALESIKKIDLNINAFEIWHFEFFCGIVLFLCIVYIKSEFFSMRSCNFKNRMSNVVQKLR